MRLGIGFLAAIVVMLGAGEAQAQRKREMIVLEMDVADLRSEVMRIARDAAISKGGRGAEVEGDLLVIGLPHPGDTFAMMETLRVALPGFDLVMRIDGKAEARLTDDGLARRLLSAMMASEAVIERRLVAAGVRGGEVEILDGMRLEVSLPAGTDEGLVETLTARGAVSFHRVAIDRDPADFDLGVAKGGFVALQNKSIGGEVQVIRLMSIISVGEIATAEASFDDYGRPSISFKLTGSGRIKFAQATSQNVGRPFAIVLDGAIISAPVINSPITGGEGQISGSFTMEEAEHLAASISSGALPARLVIVERRIDPPQ